MVDQGMQLDAAVKSQIQTMVQKFDDNQWIVSATMAHFLR